MYNTLTFKESLRSKSKIVNPIIKDADEKEREIRTLFS